VGPQKLARRFCRHGIEPAPRRASISWREFLHQQAAAILECDFFTVETLWLRRFYVLFFIELSRRRVYLAGITANPDGAWVVQQARNLTMTLVEQKQRHRIVIRDRDSKFTGAFDEVFRSEGLRLIKGADRCTTGESARRAGSAAPGANVSTAC
jgi:putative transposase